MVRLLDEDPFGWTGVCSFSTGLDDLTDEMEGVPLGSLYGSLANLPVGVLDDVIDERTILWAWFNGSPSEFSILETYAFHLSRGIEDLKKSRVAVLAYNVEEDHINGSLKRGWRQINLGLQYNLDTVLANYDLLQVIKHSLDQVVDLPVLLRECAKNGVEISEKRAKDYKLVALEPKQGCVEGPDITWGHDAPLTTNKKYDVWLDTCFSFCLTYKGLPQALVSVMAHNPRELMIHQLQGVRPDIVNAEGNVIKKGSARGLMPLDYKRFMVRCVEELAREQGFDSIGILSGYNNRWTTKYGPSGRIEMPLLHTLIKYDAFACRGGFERRQDDNLYKLVRH